jgi:hypothetical protein
VDAHRTELTTRGGVRVIRTASPFDPGELDRVAGGGGGGPGRGGGGRQGGPPPGLAWRGGRGWGPSPAAA